jgi:hypothetical protein
MFFLLNQRSSVLVRVRYVFSASHRIGRGLTPMNADKNDALSQSSKKIKIFAALPLWLFALNSSLRSSVLVRVHYFCSIVVYVAQ